MKSRFVGRSLHATAADYHSSGPGTRSDALSCRPVSAALRTQQTRHALGIAEYNGPRSPMMRCIDYPTMLKDGSGWGAMTGVSAALLAARGFTGLPAATVEANASGLDAVWPIWADLGRRWDFLDVYFKPFAVAAGPIRPSKGSCAEVSVRTGLSPFRVDCRDVSRGDATEVPRAGVHRGSPV
jgi:hypothetical protein